MYKNVARWYCRHSHYQARKKTSMDLLLSDHRPGSSESASSAIADQHSPTDRTTITASASYPVAACQNQPVTAGKILAAPQLAHRRNTAPQLASSDR
jgi:hypothetical protein